MFSVRRIFHPIGQGAFYSERHDNYNIVYDCGEWKNSLAGEKVVKQSFRKHEDIDILFISHFDFDHISKIGALKSSVRKIRNVIIPLLPDEEKHMICNIFRAMDYDILTLINSPETFFGEDTNVIKIKASKDCNYKNTNDRLQYIEALASSVELESGVKLKINVSCPEWIFVPYNHEHKVRHQQLVKNLKEKGIDVKKLTSGPEYSLNLSNEERKKIKDAYNAVDGKINQNSLFVYSGIEGSSYNTSSTVHHPMVSNPFPCSPYRTREWQDSRVGCIYSGDGDFGSTPIQHVYSQYWEHVGMIQIPHHGDLKSFDPTVLSSHVMICPISYGKKNTYGHPSSALHAEILGTGSIPIDVTEDHKSTLVQLISYRKN